MSKDSKYFKGLYLNVTKDSKYFKVFHDIQKDFEISKGFKKALERVKEYFKGFQTQFHS